MKAHILKDNVIVNTIEIDDLLLLPNLIDAGIGGSVGDSIIAGKIVPAKQNPPAIDPLAGLEARVKIIETKLGI